MDDKKPNRPRTIVLDTARLIKQNKISKEDLAKMDKSFREEVVAYAATLPDDEAPIDLSTIKPKEKADPLKGYVPTRPDAAPKVTVPPLQPKPEPKPIPRPAPHIATPPVTPPPAPKPQPKVETKPVTPPPSPAPQPAASVLGAEEDALYKKQQDLAAKKVAIIGASKGFQLERNTLLQELENIRSKEKDVEVQESHILKDEKGAPVTEQKALEEKRWALEDKRQLFEKDRWAIHQKIDAVDSKLSEQYAEQTKIEYEEAQVKKELDFYIAKKEAKKAAEDKVLEEKVYASIEAKKKKYELEWIKIKEDVKAIKDKVAKTDEGALKLKKEIEDIEAQEKSASGEKDRHALEEKRWELDKKLREIEKIVWDFDAQVDQKMKEIENIEKVFAEIQIEEENSKDKLNKYNLLIKRAE